MRNEEKLHVVGAGDVLDLRDLDAKRATAPVTPLTARAPYRSERRVAAPAPPSPAPAPMHYALLATLTWLCGPAALLLTREGRRHRGWLALGLAATAAGLALVAVPYGRLVAWTGASASLAWGSLAALATIGGFSAWARAVLLAGAHVPPTHRLPRWLRSRAGACAVGLAAPGCGMLASGGRRRAAAWLWALWPAALGLLVLRAGPGMWRHLAATAPTRAATDLLEHSLLLSAVACAAGAVAWLVQALDGARRVAPPPALGNARGDRFALALGLAALALALGGNPGRAARNLGDAALALQAEGCTVIPLVLARAADRLDPSQADYAVLAISLHEQRGEPAQAAALRSRLDAGLSSYVALLGQPAGAGRGGGTAPAPGALDPARPGGDGVYYGTMARARKVADR